MRKYNELTGSNRTSKCAGVSKYMNTDYTALLHLGHCHPAHESTLQTRGYVEFSLLAGFF